MTVCPSVTFVLPELVYGGGPVEAVGDVEEDQQAAHTAVQETAH